MVMLHCSFPSNRPNIVEFCPSAAMRTLCWLIPVNLDGIDDDQRAQFVLLRDWAFGRDSVESFLIDADEVALFGVLIDHLVGTETLADVPGHDFFLIQVRVIQRQTVVRLKQDLCDLLEQLNIHHFARETPAFMPERQSADCGAILALWLACSLSLKATN